MLNSNVKKICNFYAGEGHFLSSVVPYLATKADENNKIILIVDEVETVNNNIKIFVKRYFKSKLNKVLKNIKIIDIKSLNARDIGIANVICIKDSFKYDILDSLILYINIELIRCYPLVEKKEIVKKIFRDNEYLLNTRGIFQINKVLDVRESESKVELDTWCRIIKNF